MADGTDGDPRTTPYARLSRLARRLAHAVDGRVSVAADGPVPVDPSLVPLFEGLRGLAVSTPLERDPAAGVRETLRLDVSGPSGHAWISVFNAEGRREEVTTFGTRPGCARVFVDWCVSREDSAPGDTPWDLARRERRVVDYGGRPTLVDRGVVAICDVLDRHGRTILHSCEGHPGGAYLVYGGADGAAAAAFREAGWSVGESFGDTVVRMPPVRDVADRDDRWRETCRVVEAALRDVREPSAPGR